LLAWLRAARASGLDGGLLARFGGAGLCVATPRAARALRALGLHNVRTAVGSSDELLRNLLDAEPNPARMVVQSDDPAPAEVCDALRRRGSEVVEVAVRVRPTPPQAHLLRRLTHLTVHRQVDAVVLTCAGAAENMVAQATVDRCLDDLACAFARDVLALCLGPLSAAPLTARGLPVVVPQVPLLEELVGTATELIPRRAVRFSTAGRSIEVRGQAVVVNDELRPVPGGPLAVLRVLARQPGRVLSCADIRRSVAAWSDVDDHAIEMAVARLRRALNDGSIVQTVVKRGYRLTT
jgi:uroporphyrinogen-III synthase